MPAGRPFGTKSPDARRNRLSIPLNDAEKSFLEVVTRIMAKQRGDPGLGVSTVMREFLLEQAVAFYKAQLPEDHQADEIVFIQAGRLGQGSNLS